MSIYNEVKNTVTKIKNAVLGVEVRDFIANGIDKLNDHAEEIRKDNINTKEKQDSLEKTFKDLIIDKGNTNSEIVASRGNFDYLPERMNNFDSQIKDIEQVEVNLKFLGAKGDGINDDTSYFNIAKGLLANGGKLKIPFGEYVISEPFIIPSNVTIEGCGSEIILKDDVINSVFVTDKNIENKNITINNLYVNANYKGEGVPSIQKTYHALYFYNVNGLNFNNVFVKNPVAWCCSIELCNNININNYTANSSKAQMDGIHFVDCINVNGNNFNINSGDDCIGITVDNIEEIYNINLTNINIKSPQTGAGSGVRINQSDNSIVRQESKIIRDINILNITGTDIENRGISIYNIYSSSTVKNISINGKFTNCGREGIRAVKVDNLDLNATFENCGNYSESEKLDTIKLETAYNCNLNCTIRNIAEGKNGILLSYGQKNNIKAKINYVNTDKSNLQMCVKLENTSDNFIHDCVIDGGLRGIQVGTSSAESYSNIIINNIIKNTTGDSINEGSQSHDNLIANNSVTKNIATSNKSVCVNNVGYNIKSFESNAKPTSGTWNQGDVCINKTPTEIGDVGSKYIIEKWICIAGGTPGTWKECRVITGD